MLQIFIKENTVKIRAAQNENYNEVEYTHPTNMLFVHSHNVKFMGLVNFKTLQLMYREHCKTLLDCIQGLFTKRTSTFLKGNGQKLK